METKELLRIIEFISKSELSEVKIETESLKLSVKRNGDVVQHFATPVNVSHALPTHSAQQPVQAAPSSEAPATPSSSYDESKLIVIKSPMIGTVYRAANPESPMLVNIGDKIEIGKTVCVIEAMKLFNEIESEVSGTIVKILVENAQPVEYDQPLFLVEPN